MAYFYLAIAIVAEVIATSALKASAEFTKLVPSILVVAGYCVAFYFLTLVLRTIPVGISYAIWSRNQTNLRKYFLFLRRTTFSSRRRNYSGPAMDAQKLRQRSESARGGQTV